MQQELKGSVDVLDYQPGYVTTAMVTSQEGLKSKLAVSPSTAARACLRDLGCETVSSGAFVHGLNHWIFGILPAFLQDKYTIKNYRNAR